MTEDTSLLRTLLVDDERPARERLRRLLGAHPEVTIVAEAENGRDALATIACNGVDVVFLDIDMPVLNGLETALALDGKGPAIVFVTAYDEYAVAAFEAHAVDYLVKPIVRERLARTIERLKQGSRNRQAVMNSARALSDRARPERLAIKSGQKFLVLPLAKISAIVSRDHYAEIVMEDERCLADETLDGLAAKLDPDRFLRIHRSSLINLDFLRELRREGDRKYTAVLGDFYQSELAVSRQCLELVKEKLRI